jgi:serine/threonine-protein kinase
VFRAYDAQRERLVAVKVFKLDLPPDQAHRLVAAFERLVAADLTHPSIAAPLATGITGVSAFLAQDYVAAESLDLSLRQYGPASPADALRIAAQVAGALDFSATADVDHGVLHPRDVLTSTDETRLTGVGVARALERIGVPAPVRRPYTAPERIAGGPWDRRADVFSLAALMHEVLWGRRLSATGDQAAEGLTAIAGAHLATLQAAFARALADDPAARFDTALEFAEALKGAFPDVTLLAPAQSPVTRRRTRQAPVESGESSVESQESPEADAAAEYLSRPLEAPGLQASDDRPLVDDLPLAMAAVTPAVDDFRPATDDVRLPPADSRLPTPAAPPTSLGAGRDVDSSMLERSRSAVWPLGLALVVGIALGFAFGYGIGVREPSTSTAPSGGREFTERAVAEPTKVDEPKVQLPPESVDKKGETPAPPRAAGAPAPTKPAETRMTGPGRLLIRSTPAGALVSVDGHDSGKTPVTVRDLSTGAHRVQITHEGFAPADRRVTITPARPAQSVTITLDRMRAAAAAPVTPVTIVAPVATGTLRFESRPGGAKVYLDGKMIGMTPMSQAATAGEHGVRLELNGYRDWTSSIRVTASETSRVTASLER